MGRATTVAGRTETSVSVNGLEASAGDSKARVGAPAGNSKARDVNNKASEQASDADVDKSTSKIPSLVGQPLILLKCHSTV